MKGTPVHVTPNIKLTKSDVKKTVEKVVNKSTVDKMIDYLNKKNVPLWGADQPKNFFRKQHVIDLIQRYQKHWLSKIKLCYKKLE